jgi:3-oxoacyl-[acyl-carrier-protein] synthase II
MRRIAVSGMGAVSGLGWGIEALWEGLRTGRTAIQPFHRFDHSLHRTHLAAEVAEEPVDPIEARHRRHDHLSLADRFAVFAADEAVRAAGLASSFDPDSDVEAGVWFGSSTGGMFESEKFFHRFVTDRRRSRLGDLVSQQVNGPGDAVARHLGVTGPVQTISSACSSGALALGAALEALRSGTVDVARTPSASSPTPVSTPSARSTRTRACRSAPPARGCPSARAPRCWCSSRWSASWRAAPPPWPSSPERARRATPTT